MHGNQVLVEMKNISKYYPGVQALDDVSFTLHEGEVHSLCGENGAGKSTLIKILTGVVMKDSGTILLQGNPILPKTTKDAQNLGISTVYQEVNLCPNISVAENLFVGREPRNKLGMVNWDEMNRRAEEAMAKLNIKLDVTARLDEYSVAIQQMVAIARAVDMNAKVLVLDEPTSSLDKNEVEYLFKVVRNLKAQGLGIIFISHFFDQVFEISDTVTVLRNGRYIGTYDIENLTRLTLIEKMLGKEVNEFDNIKKDCSENENCEPFYEAEGLGKRGTIYPFDITLNKGEVTGLAGLLGSGRTETARLVFGVDRSDSGRTKVKGKHVRIRNPRDAIRNRMGFCPENRKEEGLLLNMTIKENIILALQGRMGMFKLMPKSKQNEIAEKYIKALQVATPSSEQLVGNLSGGNQQKVLVARWLAMNPELLIMDEPTRGIDVGAKVEIQKLVVDLASEGTAVLFISSELDEVLRCATKTYVYRDKHIVGELSGEELVGSNIMKTIAGESKA
ncbi:MAG: sugar ABC transporter ATP-binding protein [Acetivibrionales bacterium]